MQRTTIAIGLVAIVAVAGLLMTPVTVMTATGETGGVIACERVDRDATIALTFTHSMYGGDVTETYQPSDAGQLLRTSILTDNAAAAEYYAWDGAVEQNGGGFEVAVPDREFASIAVRVDRIGNHRLAIDQGTWFLASMVDGSERVRLSLATRPLVMQALGAGC